MITLFGITMSTWLWIAYVYMITGAGLFIYGYQVIGKEKKNSLGLLLLIFALHVTAWLPFCIFMLIRGEFKKK